MRIVVAIIGAVLVLPGSAAFAVPPTAQENPGYQRRLQESRQQRVIAPGAEVRTAPAIRKRPVRHKRH